jgi:6-phosphogluconolactonase
MPRRTKLLARAFFAVLATLFISVQVPDRAVAEESDSQSMLVYVGTIPGPRSKSQGIYVLKMDPATGALGKPELAAQTPKPSFLAFHPNGKSLIATSELDKAGAVASFAVEPSTGKLTLLNEQPSGGNGPCYVAIDPTGRSVLVANYSSGSVAVVPIDPASGRLAPASAVVQHHGSGPNAQRQAGPHAHSLNVDPTNHFALAADLGIDKLLVYRFDPARGTLEANDPPGATLAPGSGPRHLAFAPSGKFAYLANELASTVTAFAWDPERGGLTELQTVPMLPPDFHGTSTAAEVRVHPSGRWLYASNRGHDSIAVFAVDETTGRLTPRGHTSTQGKVPRNFNIDPSGKFLLAANQMSDSVVVFRIDESSGELTPTGETAEVPTPTCVRFYVER